jgi:hypothetical protein
LLRGALLVTAAWALAALGLLLLWMLLIEMARLFKRKRRAATHQSQLP